MAGSFSDFTEAEILDHVWGAATYTAPVTFHLALYTVAPTDAGGGTEVPSTNGYVRATSTNNATEWPAATGTTPTTKNNANVIAFPQASGGSWGTVVAFGFFSLTTGGDFLAWADLDTSKAIDDGDTAQFAASAITITLD
jgi:hypothetical protein